MVTHGWFVCHCLSKFYSIQIFKDDNKNVLPKLLKIVNNINNEYTYYTILNSNAMAVGEVRGERRGRDRMAVGFTTTYAISAYHH